VRPAKSAMAQPCEKPPMTTRFGSRSSECWATSAWIALADETRPLRSSWAGSVSLSSDARSNQPCERAPQMSALARHRERTQASGTHEQLTGIDMPPLSVIGISGCRRTRPVSGQTIEALLRLGRVMELTALGRIHLICTMQELK
jgi:hypothetical protein